MMQEQASVNAGYATAQWFKALKAAYDAPTAADAERVQQKASRWQDWLQDFLKGNLNPGSRQPSHWPIWVTTEVLRGGFATQRALAGGPLMAHEKASLDALFPDTSLDNSPPLSETTAREALNCFWSSPEAAPYLQACLDSRLYALDTPEEGALLVLHCLRQSAEEQDQYSAAELLKTLEPYFEYLRFYPRPISTPQYVGMEIALQDVKTTCEQLRARQPHARIMAQREALSVWARLYDALLTLWQETVVNDWPGQAYPTGWAARAIQLCADITAAEQAYPQHQKHQKKGQPFARLRQSLQQALQDPAQLTGRELGYIRLVLARTQHKRGAPGSRERTAYRLHQYSAVAAPLYSERARALAERLNAYPSEHHFSAADLETLLTGAHDPVPPVLQKVLQRAQRNLPEYLVAQGLIQSSETLARLLSQQTAAQVASAFVDENMRYLVAQLYSSFRRRRSVLLLNLQSQVRWEELPWVEVLLSQASAKPQQDLSYLRHLVQQVLTFFPATLLPNRLLQNIEQLAKQSQLKLPLVKEVAADIFMGQFSEAFLQAAQLAGSHLKGTVYARYYDIDCEALRQLAHTEAFVQYCMARANTSFKWGQPANSGRIIEQQQILTTQNLSPLVEVLGLKAELPLEAMIVQCWHHLCRLLSHAYVDHHTLLIHHKNGAYAWRHLLLYFSWLTPEVQQRQWYQLYTDLQNQKDAVKAKMVPQWMALRQIMEGQSMSELGMKAWLGWV